MVFTIKSIPPQQEKRNIWMWLRAWLWAWALWGAYALGKWLETIWKATYWVTLSPTMKEARNIQSYNAWTSSYKPVTAIDSALEAPMFQKWGRTLSSKMWMMWTRAWIGTQAEARAWNIFKKTINPLFKKAEKEWVKINYSKLLEKIKKNVVWNKKYSETDKKQILDDIKKIYKNFQWETSLKNLDLEKQWLANKLPKKYFSSIKTPQSLQNARWEVAKVFRETLHDTMKSKFWVNTASKYRDYANLKWLSWIWPKSLSQSWRKGGAWSFVSRLWEELATPVTTTVWKTTYKIWKWMQKPLKSIIKAWEYIWKNAPKYIWKWIKWFIKWWKILWALWDWAIIPWTPSSLVSKALFDTDRFIFKKWPFKWYSVWKEDSKKIWNKTLYKTPIGRMSEDWQLFM